jgi:hypothetical protein
MKKRLSASSSWAWLDIYIATFSGRWFPFHSKGEPAYQNDSFTPMGCIISQLGCLILQKQVQWKDNSEATMIVDVENVK